MTLRRDFSMRSGERALVVEDVVTTGGSAGEYALTVEMGADAIGVAGLVDRSAGDLVFLLRALARVMGSERVSTVRRAGADRVPGLQSPGLKPQVGLLVSVLPRIASALYHPARPGHFSKEEPCPYRP